MQINLVIHVNLSIYFMPITAFVSLPFLSVIISLIDGLAFLIHREKQSLSFLSALSAFYKVSL